MARSVERLHNFNDVVGILHKQKKPILAGAAVNCKNLAQGPLASTLSGLRLFPARSG